MKNMLFNVNNLKGLLSNVAESLFGENLTKEDIDNIRVKNLIEYKKKAGKELASIIKAIDQEYEDLKKKIDLEYAKERDTVSRFSIFLKKKQVENDQKEKRVKILTIQKDIDKLLTAPLKYKEADTYIKKGLKANENNNN